MISAPFMTGQFPGRNGTAFLISSAFFIRQLAPSGNRNFPVRPHGSMPFKGHPQGQYPLPFPFPKLSITPFPGFACAFPEACFSRGIGIR